MADKEDPPPPYPGTEPGQHPITNPVDGRTNYGFSTLQYQPYAAPNASLYASNKVEQMERDNAYGEPPPYDYTTQAWIACLCCFWPTGLMAIVKASESRDALARGDIVGARAAADYARQMVRISFTVGIVSVVFALIIISVIWAKVLNSAIHCDDDC